MPKYGISNGDTGMTDTILYGISKLPMLYKIIGWGILIFCILLAVVCLCALRVGAKADADMDKLLRDMPNSDKDADG